MINRRVFSDKNIHKFLKKDSEDPNLSTFLPEFLIKKIEKDQISKDNQSLFFDDDKEEEPLEIKIDHNLLKDTFHTNSSNLKSNSLPYYKKSHSQKHQDMSYDLDKFTSFFPRNHRPYKEESQNMNPNLPNCYYLGSGNKFNPYETLNTKSLSDINDKKINSIIYNMNNLNIYNGNINSNNTNLNPGIDFNANFELSDGFNEFNINNSFDISHNSNFSIDEGYHLFSLPLLKKNQSDNKNLNSSYYNPVIKSLFKEKVDTSLEEINLVEALSNNCFDLPEYIITQKGSRVLQKELNMISQENLELLLKKICPQLSKIMIDIYGNYFSQRLIQCCSPNQRLQILKAIETNFLFISCHNAGTHSIQCLIEIINTRDEEEIIKKSIQKDILSLSMNSNGTHVMQKLIEKIDEHNREYINKVLINNFLSLVFDANGICVIKKLINGNKDPSIKNKILFYLQTYCLEIIQNSYGNYIIQHIIEEWGQETCRNITKIIQNNIISLSMQKFSSNVVEKCLDKLDNRTRRSWIMDLFNFSKISSLLKNKYGNFVLQKAIVIMNADEKHEIKEYLIKKIGLISNKEKARLKALIEVIN